MENSLFGFLSSAPIEFGADKAKIINSKDISFERCFRDMCASNACGMYGKCYMCPPDVGDVEDLISQAKTYDYALVYQMVSALEDSYDFEGMTEAKKCTIPIAQKLRKVFEDMAIPNALHLGAGGCGVCETCSKGKNEPCRFPKLALPSLEAYGINVSQLAKSADMKYTNGPNTVTYFGAVLFTVGEEDE